MEKKYIIDRIEGNYIIVEHEDSSLSEISISKVIGDFKEGDILVQEEENFKVDKELTEIRRNKINHMMQNMWK